VSATTKSRQAAGRGRRHSDTPATVPVPFWRLRLLAFFVGAASLGAEIAAARLLAPYFGASTIIWANTIATVLVALSVGYALGGRLADRRALHFLPGCLARRDGIATLSLQRTPPRVQLLLGNEHVGLAASQIDPNPVAAA